ncbi:NAD-dependent epimerase/dehydratase family protein [Paenarthrobacter aromaticivorans]|uniref:NAD-dependent epimerase/dehydratase family protein n=1 Tax=Paenarthrobacter aromaticivorans TaxID=2849150 RepID=A0ABS6I9A0_9MICC|nr:NAD-dependent epimerase/dehydratase family protein [Paenarthrobacter sp. MMS21-TAE1-1]MBU8868291.1 NAD-dependent epimerase/dehydratase family protein [Paenarthrobacter sp. MMS21-TAE1-1]
MADWIVVGGSGFVGGGIVDILASSGHGVLKQVAPRVLADPKWSAQEVLAEASKHVEEIAALAASFADKDVVVNAAGLATPGGGRSLELFGANAVLPVLIWLAAKQAGVRTYVHISSAAVQGRRPVLDGSWDHQPFSPYSVSKALGERALRLLMDQTLTRPLTVRIVRATSIQDPSRSTTRSLIRFARSPLASVAAPGSAPSPVSSLGGLAEYVLAVGDAPERVPTVSVQPWEGLTVRDVVLQHGHKEPLQLPPALCRLMLKVGYWLAKFGSPKVDSVVRRAEVLWFGQRISQASASQSIGIGECTSAAGERAQE